VVGLGCYSSIKQLTKEKVNYFIVQPNQQLKLTVDSWVRSPLRAEVVCNLKEPA
jgi:hypothetical protein